MEIISVNDITCSALLLCPACHEQFYKSFPWINDNGISYWFSFFFNPNIPSHRLFLNDCIKSRIIIIKIFHIYSILFYRVFKSLGNSTHLNIWPKIHDLPIIGFITAVILLIYITRNTQWVHTHIHTSSFSWSVHTPWVFQNHSLPFQFTDEFQYQQYHLFTAYY